MRNIIDFLRHPKLRAELARHIRNFNYEVAEDGSILVAQAKVMLAGVFDVDVLRDGQLLGAEQSPNIVVNEGLNHFLDVTLSGASPITSWYVGIFEGNYTPVATDTAANIASNSTESTAYDEATRVAWTEAGASSQAITNSASKATFTMNATKTVYGAFLASASAKSATTGTLIAASKFQNARSVVATDQILVNYTLNASDV